MDMDVQEPQETKTGYFQGICVTANCGSRGQYKANNLGFSLFIYGHVNRFKNVWGSAGLIAMPMLEQGRVAIHLAPGPPQQAAAVTSDVRT